MTPPYTIIRDPRHGYLRVDPIPSREEVDHYYKEEFYGQSRNRFNDSTLEVQREQSEFFESRWRDIRDKCLEHFGAVDGLSLFDVGFGYGQALLFFRDEGFQVSGLEPSDEGYEFVSRQGLSVFKSGIESLTTAAFGRYDVVTVLNVLEHLRDPAETLVSIRERMLKPGSLLVIDVPNEFNDFQTVADAEYALGQWWVCPPVHLNYFSAASLRALLDQCGYEVRVAEASFPLELFLVLGDVYVGDATLGKVCHEKRVRFEHLMKKYGKSDKLHQLYQALAQLDLGRQVVVYATPKQGLASASSACGD